MLTASGKWQFTKSGVIKVGNSTLDRLRWFSLLSQDPQPLLEKKSARKDLVRHILSGCINGILF